MRISRGGFTQRSHLLVRASSDTGESGYGEAVGDATRIEAHIMSGAVEAELKSLLGTAQSLEVEEVTKHDVYLEGVGTVRSAFAAIEMAVVDYSARRRKVPISRLLGDGARPALNTYVSSIYWSSTSTMIEEALQAVTRGADCIKIHVGAVGVREEYERVARIADAIAPNASLIVDLNCAYSSDDIEILFEVWSDLELDWLEEPLSPQSLASLPDVCGASPWPIAVGENLGRYEEFARAVRDGVGVLMPDIGRVGYMASLKIAQLCEMEARLFSPHNFGSGVLLAGTAQLLSSLNNPGPLELDFSGNSLYEEIFGRINLREGFLPLSDSNGLGIGEAGYRFLEEEVEWSDFALLEIGEELLWPLLSRL